MDCFECLKEILKLEVKPSAGCTEIAAIGYAISLAKEGAKEPYDVELYLDYDVFKNAFAAGVPGGGFGIKAAVERGLLSEPRGLETLNTATGSYNGKFYLLVKPVETKSLFIYARVNGRGTIIADGHDRIIYNGRALNSVNEAMTIVGAADQGSYLDQIYDRSTKTVHLHYSEMLEYIEALASDSVILKLISEAIKLDMDLAEDNLRSQKYHGIARGMIENDIIQKAAKYAAAAVESRMSGSSFPAMSVSGSG
ncbi:MAG: hypothetical protein ACP5NC_07030, partial [Nitrososphaeria archaeon]